MTWTELTKNTTNQTELTKNTTNQTELTKNTVRHIITRGKVTTYRGNFGDYNTRGEIAKAVRGDASAEVTRKEMEDHFGTRNANSFTELTKNNSEWSNT